MLKLKNLIFDISALIKNNNFVPQILIYIERLKLLGKNKFMELNLNALPFRSICIGNEAWAFL